jgi:Glycosyl transferases group 1
VTSSVDPVRPLRILEIGGDCLFALAVPAQTEFYGTGIRLRGNLRMRFGRFGAITRAFGPIRFLGSLLKLRRGEYDLVVLHAAPFATWHPRSFLTVLRSWNLLSPLGLFANFAWRMVHLFHKVPIVTLDLGDSFGIGRHNFFLLDASTIYFKRELPADRWHVFFSSTYRDLPGHRWRGQAKNRARLRKLAPISYGYFYFPADFSPEKKSSDVFFAGNADPNSTARSDGLPELLALREEGCAIDIAAERLPPEEFFRRLSAAWLAWSPGGYGWDCARHYEAPLAGTVPLMNYPTIVRHRPLRDGEHCILYAPEPGALASAVRSALADKQRLQDMARAAQVHVREHHTLQARAEHVVTTALGRRLDGSSTKPTD